MWLLDANVDVHLAPILEKRGITCDTVAHRGWKALSNGELVAAAFAEGFHCLLTRDQLFGESAS
jgi:predicted nuclease of predicted toxin-antitoxin system